MPPHCIIQDLVAHSAGGSSGSQGVIIRDYTPNDDDDKFTPTIHLTPPLHHSSPPAAAKTATLVFWLNPVPPHCIIQDLAAHSAEVQAAKGGGGFGGFGGGGGGGAAAASAGVAVEGAVAIYAIVVKGCVDDSDADAATYGGDEL